MNNQQRISIVLGWSHDELSTMMYTAAFTWMRLNNLSDEQTRLLSKCGSFWQWWTNEWFIRDGDYLWDTSLRFIDEPLEGEELHIALDFYVKKHLVSKLNIRPNRLVTAELKQLILDEQTVTTKNYKAKL